MSGRQKQGLRYGENPHQEAAYFGNLDDALEQIHGKALSYNNLLDIDATVNLFASLKRRPLQSSNTITLVVWLHAHPCRGMGRCIGW